MGSAVSLIRRRGQWCRLDGTPYTPSAQQLVYDWSATNPPWAYQSPDDWEARIPTGATIVPLQTGSGDFATNLNNTVNAAGKRVIVRLPAGVHHLTQFTPYGGSGPMYAFGFWHANLQGLTGAGPDQTIIQMDPGSLSTDQLSGMATLASGATGAPLQIGMWRIDGNTGSPAYLGGLTFRAADQQNITAVDSSVSARGMVVPQPAPHNGVQFYTGCVGVASHVRWQAAARACLALPPFECGNIMTQKGSIRFYNCESDGRVAPELNPARPARGTVAMTNNETLSAMTDCWLHDSNISRYAANDQNANTTGAYTFTRCKIDHIANVQNTDPALNGGVTLGGSDTGSDALGFESSNSAITLDQCIVSQDSPATKTHMSLTTITRNPQGGRVTATGCTWRNSTAPQLDGYATFWAANGTYWWDDGPATTITVKRPDGTALAPYVPATYPPTAAALSAAGVTPQTHYIVKHP